ncbi:unnamed protein product [Prunus armeniaca]|uniref:Protein kinase domain-containing protein n=1 Tax=Prunus armeniaca TaxID=36596 RepID=A0A6J5WZV6_PRUAR|nr:unnamed protein product [Prunus armeniaca]
MRRAVFDWAKRFNIIQGVARGLVYLHHDSCLKMDLFRRYTKAYVFRSNMVRTGILTGRPKRIHVTIMEHVDLFGFCRASESPICKCLKGFVPKSHEEWSKGNRTAGCVRKTKLFCESSTKASQSLQEEKEMGFRRWYG